MVFRPRTNLNANAKMLNRLHKQNLLAATKAAGLSPGKIARAIAVEDDKEPTKGQIQPLAVNQARTCELLSCWRFHVRKLEKLRLLKPVHLAGLKRYPVADVMKLVGV